MTDVPEPAPRDARTTGRRRVPQQVRSRDRVARILEVAARMVGEHGVDGVSTRSVAAAAGVPVATLYQYFADKEGILLALVERDVAEMDAQVTAGLAELDVLSVRSMVETTMRAFVDVYHRRPSFVTIWFRGRTNPAVNDYCRAQNRRLARRLFEVARSAGMVLEDSDGLYAELAIEVADRIFELAFEGSLTGDPHVIDEGIALVTAYLERHATPAGIAGVRR
jgi:AcrR family transcriptional regulator